MKPSSMRNLLLLSFLVTTACTSLASCNTTTFVPDAPGTGATTAYQAPKPTSKMKITIGTRVFKATLADNATATAFKALLPMTIAMTELNANEKYADLAHSLPASASQPATIQNGDLMLYGSQTLVLFYKTFSTSYSYTKLGQIDDATGLAEALGSGNATVTYERED